MEHLNLRESTMLYSTYPVNSSKETKRLGTLGLSFGEACSGSTEIHSVLTVIKLIHESACVFLWMDSLIFELTHTSSAEAGY